MSEENPPETKAKVDASNPAKPARAALNSTARLKKFNERLGLILSLGAKLVAVAGVVMLAALILGQVFRSETFSIGRLDVPGELETAGYTGKLIARHIADDMRSPVENVPETLASMFVVDPEDEEEKKRLKESIVEEYEERKDQLNISLSFAMFDLPVDQFLVHIREWLGIDNTTVESAITIEDTTISMSVGLVKNGDTQAFEVFHEHYDKEVPNSMYQALDRLVSRTAEFILKTNHPIVMILQDYHYVPGREYSERDELWSDKVFTATERIKILEDRSENPPDDSRQIEKWAHAILGVIRDDQKNREKAIDHYQAAIKADSHFVTTVGPKLVRLLAYDQSWQGCGNAIMILDDILALDAANQRAVTQKLVALRCQRPLIADQPDKERAVEVVVDSYKRLLRQVPLSTEKKKSVQRDLVETLAEFDGKSEEFYRTLESALNNGLKLSDDDLAFEPWDTYKNEPRFLELLDLSSQ